MCLGLGVLGDTVHVSGALTVTVGSCRGTFVASGRRASSTEVDKLLHFRVYYLLTTQTINAINGVAVAIKSGGDEKHVAHTP